MMADRVSIDIAEIRALAADLTAAGSGITDKVRPVVHKGAVKIKAQMRRDMQASRHFRQITPSIDYTMHGGMLFGVGVIEAEIGPRSGPGGVPGDLAPFAYFGTSTRGGTVPDPQLALEAEQPHFERALLDIIGDLL